MEPATDPTPFLTWSGVATPDTAILALGLIAVVAIGALVLFEINAIRLHLRATRIHVRETRDWFRRSAAEQRSADFHTLVYQPELLTRLLSLSDRQSAATLQEIREAKSQDSRVIDSLHSLLSYYDGLARGVQLGIYSERIVKAAHQDNMTRAQRIFRPYIDQYRMETAPGAWASLDQILTKWEEAGDDAPPPPHAKPVADPRKRAA